MFVVTFCSKRKRIVRRLGVFALEVGQSLHFLAPLHCRQLPHRVSQWFGRCLGFGLGR
jgi:hypothetical protein